MEILKTEDIKEEALDVVDSSAKITSGMEYEENVEEEKNPYDPQINIKIEINDIKHEGELELSYEQLKSIKIEDAFPKRDNECIEHTNINSCISLDKLEPDNRKCIEDIEIIKPEPREEIDTFDDMETQSTDLLWEHNYCKYGAGDIIRHCKYENNSQRHLKFDTQGLSSKNMAIVKNEDIKKEVTNMVDLSSVKVCPDIDYVEHITHEFDIPLNEVGLESIKYEENIKEEISTSYDTEMGIKTEVNDIKDEEYIDELNLNHEQAKSMKVKDEVHKRNCSNECLEHTNIESCSPLDKLEPDNIHYNKNTEMIRSESNEQKDTSDDIEVDLEKQNAFLRWEHNYCKYETVDVKRHSKYTNIIQRHLSHLQQQESNLSYKNMDSIKTEDMKGEVIDIDDSSSTEGSDIQVNEVGLASMKYEEIVEEKNGHQTEVEFKKEIDDIKADIDTEEHELSCEQMKSINIENAVYKRDCSNKYMEHPHTKSLDSSEPKREYVNNIETSEPLLPAYKAKDKSIMRTQFQETRRENLKYFKCRLCDYVTKHRSGLKEDFTRKHSENTELYQCFSCKYKSKFNTNLVRHCRLKHNRHTEWLKRHMCDFQTESKQRLLQHHIRKQDAAKVFNCELCDFKTKYKRNLLQHNRLKHDDTAEIYHCELCDLKTKSKHYLFQHHRSIHDDAAEIFHCALCDLKTKSKHSLSQHHRIKHNDAAEIFHCEVCDFKTKHKYYLRRHGLKHDDGAEIFLCELCDFKTKYKHSLLQHHRMKHNDAVEMFHCEVCNFKTKDKYYLLQRHRLKHDKGAEIFLCELCEFKTKYKHSLSQHHRIIHNDTAKIFQCALCDFKTKNKHYLLSHRSTVHNDSAEIIYCKLCNFKTKYKYNLLEHYKLKHERGL